MPTHAGARLPANPVYGLISGSTHGSSCGSPRRLDALVATRWPKGFECPDCGSKRRCRIARGGLFQCLGCRHQASATAGTIFHATKLPLTVWFLAMHLLTQGKHSVSALELKRQLGVCYETAWAMKQKILQVMLEREDERTVLSGRIEVDDAYMGGERHEGKPGRGAAGQTAFAAAVMTDPENPARVLPLRLRVLRHAGGKELAKWFAKGFVKGSEIHTDEWSGYTFLDTAGFRHVPHEMQGGWRNGQHPAFRWVNTVLGNLKGNVRGVTRWVGKVHLDRYLAEFQWRFNGRFDPSSCLPRLLTAAVRTPAMPQRLLKVDWLAKAA